MPGPGRLCGGPCAMVGGWLPAVPPRGRFMVPLAMFKNLHVSSLFLQHRDTTIPEATGGCWGLSGSEPCFKVRCPCSRLTPEQFDE